MVRNGVTVYVVDCSLFSGFVGNQLAEPDGSERNGGTWIFSRHGGSGRFEPADILCGHSSGGGGQHHESLHASLWQTRFQRTVNKAFFAVAAVVRAWSFLNDKASRRAGARVSTRAALSLYSWLSSPLA